MTDDNVNKHINFWPLQPYKGLDYYGPEDEAIFAGREDDVNLCARLLSNIDTRIMILHGMTGSGKSSFLRAGLIPFLERYDHGFSFIKEIDNNTSALFVRSTHDPISQICEVIYGFSKKERSVKTPLGLEHVDLSSTINGLDLRRLALKSKEDPTYLISVLEKISRKISETLVIVIDQVEEVITLKPGYKEDNYRSSFFDLLKQFALSNLDIKIVLSIRTEFYSRIMHEFRRRTNSDFWLKEYFLADLNTKQLIEAIERPTSKKKFGEKGCPHNQYKFSYDKDVAQIIARDLQQAIPAGGVLPVLQIVCDRLYRSGQQIYGENFKITIQDYEALGGISGQINALIDDSLYQMCVLSEINGKLHETEVLKWRNVISDLALKQIDGTVTSAIKTIEEFKTSASENKCLTNPDTAIEILSDPSIRIIRHVTIYNTQREREIYCVALGHDALGVVVKENLYEQTTIAVTRGLKNVIGFLISAGTVITVAQAFITDDSILRYLAPVLAITVTLLIQSTSLSRFLFLIAAVCRLMGFTVLSTNIQDTARYLSNMQLNDKNSNAYNYRSVSTRRNIPVSIRDYDVIAVLRAASLISTRTSSGIVKDSGLSREVVLNIIDKLLDEELLIVVNSKRTGSPRFKITRKGTEFINNPPINGPLA